MDMNFRCLESPQIRKAEDGSRKMTFVASDGTRDSAHTVLNPEGWDLKRFNNNGIIGYQHKVYGSFSATENPDNIIGKGRAYIEEIGGKKCLLVDVEFEPEGMNELADKVFKKLQFGTLKAVSVGFVPLGKGAWGKGEEGPGETRETYYYAGQELLEVSVVNIPSNPNALRRSDDPTNTELEALRREAELVKGPQQSTEDEVKAQAEQAQRELDKATILARAASLI